MLFSVERSFEPRFACLHSACAMLESLPITTAGHRPRHIRNDDGAVPAYLAALNAEQSRAVEYGVGVDKLSEAGPLLIIAGAGSGKTNTLAYRVAHLVLTGVDPRRILLLTFSRRAAEEMVRRAGQVLSRVFDPKARRRPPELPW